MKKSSTLFLAGCSLAVTILACTGPKPGGPHPVTPNPVTPGPGPRPTTSTEMPAPDWSKMDPSVCRTTHHAGVANLGMCSAQGMPDVKDPATSFSAAFGTLKAVKEREKDSGGVAAINLRYRWPKGKDTLRVAFRDDPYGLQNKVIQIANRWNTEGGANLTFVKAPSWDDSDIRVTFQGQGYWSHIGTYANKHRGSVTMSLSFEGTPSAAELRRVTLHEFGHAIGMIHEHKSPTASIQWDRGAVIRFYTSPPNCWSESQVVQQVLNSETDSTIVTSGGFDPYSIMAYGVHKSLTVDGRGIPWNTDLSPTDKKFIASQYPKTAPTP